jgi:hypothetical protein
MASRGIMRPPNAPLHQQSTSQPQQRREGAGHNIPIETNNENLFKTPSTLGLPSAVKRKLSSTELNPNTKVHLRRQSNQSSTDNSNHNNNNGGVTTSATTTINNSTTTPAVLGTRPLSSLDHDVNTAALPTLILAPFEPSPWLEFGKVVVGSKKTVSMMVENLGEGTERLSLDPGCKMEEKGFNIIQLDPLHTRSGGGASAAQVEQLALGPRSKIVLTISWTPLTAGSVRASAILRSNNGRFMVNLRGSGDVPVSFFWPLHPPFHCCIYFFCNVSLMPTFIDMSFFHIFLPRDRSLNTKA